MTKLKEKKNWIASKNSQIHIDYIFKFKSYLFLILDRDKSKDGDTRIQFNWKNWVDSIDNLF
jgi:hypothetical protein